MRVVRGRGAGQAGVLGARARARALRIAGVLAALAALAALLLAGGAPSARGTSSPVEHVVVILQENHSFDNVLGALCEEEKRECDFASSGKNQKGETIPLSSPALDIVPQVEHNSKNQAKAMDKGKMDGWESVPGCTERQCYTRYLPGQIPSLSALAAEGAISDRFFSRDIVPSWGGHIDFFAQTLDNFRGDNPIHVAGAPKAGLGWGCDSNKDAFWIDPETKKQLKEPSCIPDKNGNGPYRASPVQYVPTFGDRLDEAGKTWGIYGATNPKSATDKTAYQWAICPTFAECLYGPQHDDLHEQAQFITDAATGALPNFSILIPSGNASAETSQHNGRSMIKGDNAIGEEVQAVESGPDAESTTIFIYYDDCGCFYDHVAPPPEPRGLGIRLPLVIVSHFARIGYTDHATATNSSILAYAEHLWGVEAVNENDATAYDFEDSFDYEHPHPLAFKYVPTPIPRSSRGLNAPPPDAT
jgi:phospholipase C